MASDHSRVERQRAPAHAAPAGPQAPIAPRRRSCPPAFRFAASRIRGFATSRTPQNRADVARDAAARFGVEMTQIYWTLGHYDLVVTIEAPDDESATAFALAVASGGNMRMKTLRAFSKNELAPIIGKLGRQHATKGRHLAGFPMQGRLFSPRLPEPVRRRARTGSGVAPAGDDAIRPVARQGRPGPVCSIRSGQGVCGVRTTLPAAWRIRRGWLAGGARPSSVVKSRQSGLLAHSMETPAHANAAGRRLFSNVGFIPTSQIRCRRSPTAGIPASGRNACAPSQPCRRRGTEFTSGTPPARKSLQATANRQWHGACSVGTRRSLQPRPIDSQSIT